MRNNVQEGQFFDNHSRSRVKGFGVTYSFLRKSSSRGPWGWRRKVNLLVLGFLSSYPECPKHGAKDSYEENDGADG